MTLIDEVRRMTGAGEAEYTSGGVEYWTDEQIEELLAESSSQRAIRMRVDPDGLSGNIPLAGAIDPNDPGVIRTSGYNAAVSFEVTRDGQVTFDDEQRYGWLSWFGRLHQPQEAAARLCEAWASAVKFDVDVSADGQSMSRSQKFKNLMDLAKTLRSQGAVDSVDTKANW